MVNKEIFVMLTFFVSVVGLLGIVISGNITVANANVVTVNTNSSAVINKQNAITCTYQNATTPLLFPVINNPAGNAIGNFLTWLNQPLVNFFTGQQGSTNGNGTPAQQCNSSTNLAGFSPVGSSGSNTIQITSIGELVAESIVIGGIFVGLGLLAGTLGAGQLANIVSATGLGIALIYFMQSILSSQYFTGIPFLLKIFLDAITGAFFVWIVIVFLRD